MRLVVGLGNPGEKYYNTRHNLGFLFIDYLASLCGVVLEKKDKWKCLLAKVELPGVPLFYLLKPLTYMNLSGESVISLVKFYNIPRNSIYVVHDELDLPIGSIKVSYNSSAAGHNGVSSIIKCVGGKDFYRLRIGIGHPGDRSIVSDYVLSPLDKLDKDKTLSLIEHSAPVFLDYLSGSYSFDGFLAKMSLG